MTNIGDKVDDDELTRRVTRLEDSVDRLGLTFERHSDKTNAKLADIATLLTVLVRIDERQTVISERLIEGSATMKDHEVRLKKIEVVIPGLTEKSRWMVLGGLGGLALIGTEVVTKLWK